MPPRTAQARVSQRPQQSQASASQVDEADLDDGQQKTMQEFLDADSPLDSKTAPPKMVTLEHEWKNIGRKAQEAIEALALAAEELAEAYPKDDEEGKKILAQIDEEVRSLLDQAYETKQYSVVLHTSRQMILGGEDVENADHLLEAGVGKKMEEYQAKSARQKYGKSTEYQDFREKIWEVHHPGENMPDVRSFLEAAQDDEEGSDDDIEIGAAQINFKCPITQNTLDEPVQNPQCKHFYSKDAIEQYIRSNGTTATKCAVAGCSAVVPLSALRKDDKMIKRLKRYKQQDDARKEELAATQRAKQMVVGESEDEDEDEDEDEPKSKRKSSKMETD